MTTKGWIECATKSRLSLFPVEGLAAHCNPLRAAVPTSSVLLCHPPGRHWPLVMRPDPSLSSPDGGRSFIGLVFQGRHKTLQPQPVAQPPETTNHANGPVSQ